MGDGTNASEGSNLTNVSRHSHLHAHRLGGHHGNGCLEHLPYHRSVTQ